jgi:AraC-like DNA-binding protein
MRARSTRESGSRERARVEAEDPRPAVHPLYLRLLLERLRALGVDPAPLLRGAGLAPAQAEGESPVGLSALRRLVPAALAASGRPWLGLELGASVPVFGHGALGQAAAASGSLRQVLELLTGFIGLRAPALRLQLRETASGPRLMLEEALPLGPARSFVFEAAWVMLERLLTAASARDLSAVRYELPWPPPPWAEHYRDFLAGRVHFDARRASLLLPAALADAPCLGADPQALAFARAECERRLARGEPGRELLAELRRRLLSSEGGFPGSAQMAAELGLAERSFLRALQRAGASYRGLVDEIRRERAQALLRDTDLPIAAIAERLGYADASNFSRCARRWFGVSAASLRRRPD